MGNKSKSNISDDTNNDSVVVESKPSEKPTPIPREFSLGHFLSNSKEQSVRRASNYIYVGFRKYCEIQKFAYRASNDEWLKRFKEYITKDLTKKDSVKKDLITKWGKSWA